MLCTTSWKSSVKSGQESSRSHSSPSEEPSRELGLAALQNDRERLRSDPAIELQFEPAEQFPELDHMRHHQRGIDAPASSPIRSDPTSPFLMAEASERALSALS